MDEIKMNKHSCVVFFLNELLRMVDEGYTESVEVIEHQLDNRNVVAYLHGKYGIKNINLREENFPVVEDFIDELYYSINKGLDNGIKKNGLVLLAFVIIERFESEACDYRINCS